MTKTSNTFNRVSSDPNAPINWELDYCKKCIQMTNHNGDGECLKCSQKTSHASELNSETKPNTSQEKKE